MSCDLVKDVRRDMIRVLTELRAPLESELIRVIGSENLPLRRLSGPSREDFQAWEAGGIGLKLAGMPMWQTSEHRAQWVRDAGHVGQGLTVEDLWSEIGEHDFVRAGEILGQVAVLSRLARHARISDGVDLPRWVADQVTDALGLDPESAAILLCAGPLEDVADEYAAWSAEMEQAWEAEHGAELVPVPLEIVADALEGPLADVVPIGHGPGPSAVILTAVEAAWELERRRLNCEAKRNGGEKVAHRCDAAFVADGPTLKAIAGGSVAVSA